MLRRDIHIQCCGTLYENIHMQCCMRTVNVAEGHTHTMLWDIVTHNSLCSHTVNVAEGHSHTMLWDIVWEEWMLRRGLKRGCLRGCLRLHIQCPTNNFPHTISHFEFPTYNYPHSLSHKIPHVELFPVQFPTCNLSLPNGPYNVWSIGATALPLKSTTLKQPLFKKPLCNIGVHKFPQCVAVCCSVLQQYP